MPDSLAESPLAGALSRLREETRAEFRRFGKRLEALEQEALALRNQMERSAARLDQQLETLEDKAEIEIRQAAPLLPPAEDRPAFHGEPQTEEAAQKLHRDAARYARLLVSEIELYHKAEVARGRASKNLYGCLRQQIDRGYQAYQNRFSRPDVEQRHYFHEEIVRTLAQNDASLLGPGYPLPSE